MNTSELIAEASSLPLEERARLVDSLLQTLNPADDSLSNAWLALARHRLAELDNGSVEAVPGAAVFEKVRQRLGQ
jgi:putative addiction module component (TIGR02574 family)